jgi:hypothetical protein
MYMKFLILLLSTVLLCPASGTAAQFDHSKFDTLLQKYVSDGLVNYREIKANPRLLNEYLAQLENVNPTDFQTWSRDEQMAFWINAYNAITIEGIIRNYPIQWGGLLSRIRFPQNSIRQISDFWDTVFISVMGKDITLNQIEHNILRKEFGDPRIHFAIVCASLGCPKLESYAFSGDSLDKQLNRVTRDFINNSGKVRLDQKDGTLYLSSIFDWYKEDFPATPDAREQLGKYDKDERGVIEFVLRYLPETQQNYIIKNQPSIKYLKYDWALNEQS